jgi:1,4-alpha-glucan branching enzyme
MEYNNSLAPYLFHEGTSGVAYEYLGVHKVSDGYIFRVWAPNADRVWLVGDFNEWTENTPLHKITAGGIWEVALSERRASVGDKYKFKILGGGRVQYKADPYAREAGRPPETASVIPSDENYSWRDGGWMSYRARCSKDFYSQPMNIYELHAGSWRRHEDGSYFSYSELARELAPYVKQMGYTHIELLPMNEYPCDESWGYQICSYFAPTSRYGNVNGFKDFVDSMHEAGIGVILDWVPAHFPKDEHGLCEFDGAPLYEYSDVQKMEHSVWGTRRFDLGRGEVRSFLISSADYMIREFHIDALRVDAVASMIYLDYDKKSGEWTPNKFGDNRCLEGIEFIKRLNTYLKREFPDVILIAEDSSAWKGITGIENGGLGFDLKWNMGWMNDTLLYAECEPHYRKYHHEKLTFPMTYAFDEKFVLPISHDEVVHEKRSFLDKMSGDYWQKFASARAFMGYMMTIPGKKLSFMGSEIGQFREWDFDGEIEWFLLEYETHAKFQRYVAELNHFYLSQRALWEVDNSWDGFRWIEPDDSAQSVISYRRIAKDGSELIVAINFTPTTYREFLIGTEAKGTYEEIFNSDDQRFGGSGVVNFCPITTTGIGMNGCKDSVKIKLPPLSFVVLHKK